MDAEQTLALVRRLNSFEVTLESGRRYTLVLPSMERMIMAGAVPLPIMREAAKAEIGTETDEVTLEAGRVMFETYDRWLAEAIIGVEGEDVTMTVEAVKLIPDDDREELLEYLKREKDPKASNGSGGSSTPPPGSSMPGSANGGGSIQEPASQTT